MLPVLKALQECLGEFQDSEVQAAAIRTFAAEMMAEGTARPSTLLAMGELAGQLDADQQHARATFAGIFAAFTAATRKLHWNGGDGTDEGPRDLQPQGWRREDVGRREPRPPRRPRRAAHAALGPRPAGRGDVHVPHQAAGQGREQGARAEDDADRSGDQGHRLRSARPPARRLLLPQHGPPPRRPEEAGPAAAPAARPAGRRVRRRHPRLPAQHLAGVRERHGRRRPAARAAHPGDPLAAHAGSARRLPRRVRRPGPARAGLLLDGRPAQAPAQGRRRRAACAGGRTPASPPRRSRRCRSSSRWPRSARR